MEAEIIKTYFAERHKQFRIAVLEQRLENAGVPKPQSSTLAIEAFQQFFKKEMKSKGIKAGLFFGIGLIMLIRVITLTNQQQGSSFMQVSFSLALVAFALVQGLIWGMQLFALKEEISSFRELRRL
ncbi:hypothetical protein DVR12_26100 [Chitinophaga silvatica]|uniref:Uncharacterized protein n=1 Tax=Chitinophaga silvatica TaxID=2282649 RepID=A0A3E1Y2E4_9BACT|nr:hypothetical protein [Chitinophaga silvatica]RFS18855.1 hypothetical protein DVR12_26100 [Chitinophaga silvatica]